MLEGCCKLYMGSSYMGLCRAAMVLNTAMKLFDVLCNARHESRHGNA
jgi:hypothetical protein